ncbi:MAG: ABC transporter ATP-binding protein [Deltaproteobacteria bacterium]|nr:ABC transporter ATP-binding protein [Deltaproteobacteria bacterium]
MKTKVEAKNLCKSYGGIAAVEEFSHIFAPGRVTTILGPSGSGKSTTLSMVAGLLEPDGGQVHCDDVDITNLPAAERNFGMVFQSYALFPHMTVLENVEFGLRVRGVERNLRRQRAGKVLEMLHIAPLADRRIRQISGGEQQRVAVARALAFDPQVLLMDEPLSALDAKLRETLRAELFKLLQELGVTTIYVTHDQIEAMSLGYELIIMNAGRIAQTGRPYEVYSQPANTFVANFLGSTNMVAGECVEFNGARRLHLPFARMEVADETPLGECWAVIRPEDMEIAEDGGEHFYAEFESSIFLGNQVRLFLRVGEQRIIVDVPNDVLQQPRQQWPLQVKTSKICILSKEQSRQWN